jgi:alkane 1-monooxygenase
LPSKNSCLVAAHDRSPRVSWIALLRGGPFLFPAIFIGAAVSGWVFLLYAAVALHLIIIASEMTVGRYYADVRIPPLVEGASIFEQACLFGWIVAHFAALAAALYLVARTNLSVQQIFATAAIFGYSVNTFSATVAHEQLHRQSTAARIASQILYIAMMYPHFPTIHVVSHHRWAGTDEDCQSPRAGQSIHAYLAQALRGGFRVVRTDLSYALDPYAGARILVCLGLLTTAALLLPLSVTLFLLIQGLFAFLLIETINYIQHYKPASKSKDVGERPALISQDLNFVSRCLLLNLPLHASHHERDDVLFTQLSPINRARTFRTGYWTSFWLAWTPPVWHRLRRQPSGEYWS